MWAAPGPCTFCHVGCTGSEQKREWLVEHWRCDNLPEVEVPCLQELRGADMMDELGLDQQDFPIPPQLRPAQAPVAGPPTVGAGMG
jgi:hypothetical protein